MRCVAAIAIALLGSTGLAHAEIEVGGTAGLHTFSEDSDLGIVEDMTGDPAPQATSLKNSALFAFRIGVFFGKSLGVEVEAGAVPTEPRTVLFDVWTVVGRAEVVYKLPFLAKFNPFVAAGAGVMSIVDVGATQNENVVEKGDTKFAPLVGIGAKYRTTGAWGVRADVRGLMVPKVGGGVVPEVEALLSVYRVFGGKPLAKKVEPPPEPVNEDPDNDAVASTADRCPTDPEDPDGFEDEDGCPDLDNDKDKVPDASDKCAAEAEDMDGFEDGDGCPDPDNDKDNIPDATDKCKDEPETVNGFEDEDGCKDELPAALTQVMGVVPGVTFRTNSADLSRASKAALDKVLPALVLPEVAGVKLEIAVHTDDVAPRGKFTDNDALSQARADAIKAYLVSKGVADAQLVAKGYGAQQPAVDPTGLKGRELNAARTQNRRVELKVVAPTPAAAATPAAPPTPAAAPAPAAPPTP